MNNFNQKRINLLLGCFAIIASLLCWRLFEKQVVEHSDYVAKAESQYTTKKLLPAERGKIYSSDKMLLAANSRLYDLVVVPRQIPTAEKLEIAKKLAEFAGKTELEVYNLINNDKYYIVPLKKRMTEEEGQKITELKLKGVSAVAESLRSYPQGQLASQILGFVDNSGTGRYGLEGFYNDELKGVGGQIFGSSDTKGRLFNINSKSEAKNGSDFYLTIDSNIQYQAEQILASSVEKYMSDSGTMIVCEAATGKILAMANYPTFDPNEYNKVTDQSLFNDPAINNAYEPGSIFKPLIVAAAIDKGLVQPDTKHTFGSSVKVDSFTIRTSTGQAYGEETMTQVLENSDNVAMVWLSDLLQRDGMYKYIKDFGFGRKTGIELAGESTGSVSLPNKWSNAQLATISFGQGITTTPLQILMATNAIANQGKLMQPYIVEKVVNTNGEEKKTQAKEVMQVMREDTAKKVGEMMVSVVVNGHGKKAAVTGYRVAGKTGTAQVPSPGGGYYADRHIGSFAGFAPVDNPRFSMIVRLNNPKNVDWAESSAAPTFGEMAKWMLDYLAVVPTEPIN
jgi:cell division protein FtsI/penicillin-binding protein 2